MDDTLGVAYAETWARDQVIGLLDAGQALRDLRRETQRVFVEFRSEGKIVLVVTPGCVVWSAHEMRIRA